MAHESLICVLRTTLCDSLAACVILTAVESHQLLLALPGTLRLFAAVPKPDGYLGSVFGFLLAAARMHDCTPKCIPPVSEIALAGCSPVQTANGMPRWPW